MGLYEIIEVLVKSGAQDDFSKKNRCGMSPFDYAPVKLRASLIPLVPKHLLPEKK